MTTQFILTAGALGFMALGGAIVFPAARWDLRHRRAVRRAEAAKRAGIPIRTQPTVPGPVPREIGVHRHRAVEPPPVVLLDPVHSPITDLGVYRVAVAEAARRRPDLTNTWRHPHIVRQWKAGIDQASRAYDDVLRDMGPPPSGGHRG